MNSCEHVTDVRGPGQRTHEIELELNCELVFDSQSEYIEALLNYMLQLYT